MKVDIDVNDIDIDALFVQSLEYFINSDISEPLPMFSFVDLEEKKKVKRLKKAFKIVAGWYGSEKYKDYEELLG
jgi:hypothetical protein